MATRRIGYSTPRTSAGVMGIGSETFGGLKFDPKVVLIVALIFVIGVNVVNYIISLSG